MAATAEYVLDLVEELIRPSERERRFDWALGDVSSNTGRAAKLPFDAVWEDRKLIVEIDEDQHREATPHFDKPGELTVSGVDRGEQRRIYDLRKRESAMTNGYLVIAIPWSRSRPRDPIADLAEVRSMLSAAGIDLGGAASAIKSEVSPPLETRDFTADPLCQRS